MNKTFDYAFFNGDMYLNVDLFGEINKRKQQKRRIAKMEKNEKMTPENTALDQKRKFSIALRIVSRFPKHIFVSGKERRKISP